MAKKKARTTRTPKKSKPDWAPRFLQALALTANIKAASAAARVGRRTVYDRRDGDEDFAKAMADALDDAIDALELEARRRAHDGLRRVKFHQGDPVMVPVLGKDGRPLADEEGNPVLVPYVEHEYSDTLMIFLLKAHRPERYRDNVKVDHAGIGSSPDNPVHVHHTLTLADVDAARRLLGVAGGDVRQDGGPEPLGAP